MNFHGQKEVVILLNKILISGNRRELRVFLGNLMMTMTPSRRQRNNDPFSEIKVMVESEELRVPADTWIKITYKGQEYGSIYRSSDNVFQVILTKKLDRFQRKKFESPKVK